MPVVLESALEHDVYVEVSHPYLSPLRRGDGPSQVPSDPYRKSLMVTELRGRAGVFGEVPSSAHRRTHVCRREHA